MFEDFRQYPVILVSGPPRSGTWIASRMIAHDTGHRLVSEKSHGFWDRERLERALREGPRPMVVHCPSHTAWLHELAAEFPEALIVFLLRPASEIVRSEERVIKTPALLRLTQRQYRHLGPVPKIAHCLARHSYWLTGQRHLIANRREIHYADLAAHPLWVDQEHRRDFTVHQTTPEGADPEYPKEAALAPAPRRRILLCWVGLRCLVELN